jgi:Bacteriocin-protection, YdeI or OmpD-Associated
METVSEALIEARRMAPSGQAAFEARDLAPPRKYSFESKPEGFAPAYLKRIRANPRAFAYFKTRPPGYVRTHAFWVMSPANEETRLRRLEILVGCWERGEPAPPLARTKKAAAR